MPRRKKVSIEDVELVVKTLESSGRKPTVKAVREQTGGGTDTVSRFLRRLRTGDGARGAPDTAPPENAQGREPAFVTADPECLLRIERQLAETRRDVADLAALVTQMAKKIEAACPTQRQPPSSERQDTLERAQELRNQGLSLAEVAKGVGMSARWVQLHTFAHERQEATSQAEIRSAKDLRRAGASYAEISRRTGRSWDWAKRHAG
ncbi:MAG: hypothetical protein HQL38_00850 [Alphaproteobacteria bacterium]|nr:hypothetical protein [Alphaproteobacteria bacterium]